MKPPRFSYHDPATVEEALGLLAAHERNEPMKGRPGLFVGILLGVLTVLRAPTPLIAAERTCRGALGAVTVDNLRVPDDGHCVLNGTRVKGNIRVESSATLDARGVRVTGNVQAENARAVSLTRSSRIGGSV